jgi:hypothetical protein
MWDYNDTAAGVLDIYGVAFPPHPYFACFLCGALLNGTGLAAPWDTVPSRGDARGPYVKIDFYPPYVRDDLVVVESLFTVRSHRGTLKAWCGRCADSRGKPPRGEQEIEWRAAHRTAAFLAAAERRAA